MAQACCTTHAFGSVTRHCTYRLRLFASKLDSYSRQSLAGPSAVATYNEKLITLLKKGLALDVGEAWLRRRFQVRARTFIFLMVAVRDSAIVR